MNIRWIIYSLVLTAALSVQVMAEDSPSKAEVDAAIARWAKWRNDHFPNYPWKLYGTSHESELWTKLGGDRYLVTWEGNEKGHVLEGAAFFQLLERYVEGESPNRDPFTIGKVEDGAATVVYAKRLPSLSWRITQKDGKAVVPATPAPPAPPAPK